MQAALLAIALAACLAVASAQPFTVNGEFAPRLTERAQRAAVNYTGFVFDFRKAKKADGGSPNGSLKGNNVGTNPFTSTLPGDGNAQTLVTLGPCAGNIIHNHPRGSEISFVTRGEMLFGMIEENGAAGNRAVNRYIRAGETIHIPQGLIHYSHNPTCGQAQFLASFATADPGVQSTWNSLLRVPSEVLHLSTGIPRATFDKLREYPRVLAPGTGGERCLKRCGLKFSEENIFEPRS